MKKYLPAIWLFFFTVIHTADGQTRSIDRNSFFTDTSVLNATLVTDMTRLFASHKKNNFELHGRLLTSLTDGTAIDDPVLLAVRGHSRLVLCYVPPIKMTFNVKEGSAFFALKSLKLVSECKISNTYDQYLLKEYLVYKIFNLLTDKSFRVRLLNLNFQDSAGRKKPITEHAFLLEDIKSLAKRNNCIEWKKGKLNTESTDRRQMTLVSLFEYMIGNTDWAVSVTHNIKLIAPEKDPTVRPFSVPYDFDYSGLVNTDYAVPDERLEIENVRQRVYRGYARSMTELQEILDIFQQQKANIFGLVNNFSLLTTRSKQDITDYLNEFYKTINRPDMVKAIFIDNALTQ